MAELVFITGAGISEAAGIPIFRGPEGIYTDPTVREVFSKGGFEENPERTWEHLSSFFDSIDNAVPTASHLAISQAGSLKEALVITQNIDNLHERAGSKGVHHLHGDARTAWCTCCTGTVQLGSIPTEPPQCTAKPCTGRNRVLHPGIVLFGEPPDYASRQKLRSLSTELPKYLFVIGTAASLPYIQESIRTVSETGPTTIIEVNLGVTAVSKFATTSFYQEADAILPEIVSEII